MRFTILHLTILSTVGMHAQTAHDDAFICERWVLNSGPSLLEFQGVDRGVTFEEAERIRTYALDEPYYWGKRIFLRIDPKKNPALLEKSPADSIRPFIAIVNEALAAGDITFFKDLDYDGSDDVHGHEPVMVAPMILKVDFHIDTLTLRAMPYLVGLSVERPGGGYAHMYYPELSYPLRDYKVRTKQGLVSYDEYFKGFFFNAEWLNCADIPSEFACKPIGPSLEQQSELDALSELYLLERVLERDAVVRRGERSFAVDLHPMGHVKAHVVFDPIGRITEARLTQGDRVMTVLHFVDGVPHGPYRAFHRGGGLREEGLFEHGLRVGNWNSWHHNSNIRSHRNYEKGRLHGEQQVYHPNGQLWLEYHMASGDYEGPHKTWYPDGELKASGMMHDGFISGEWDYAIRLSPVLMAHLDQYNGTQYHLPEGSWKDGMLSYHVTVTDNGQPGVNSCMMGRCIQWAFSSAR